MMQFDQFVARHGEIAAQALLENLERFEGVRPNTAICVKQRWENLMLRSNREHQSLAA